MPALNVRIQNSSNFDIHYEATKPGGGGASGDLNQNQHDDYMVNDPNTNGFDSGERQLVVSTEFPHRIRFSQTITVTEDYTLISILDNRATLSWGVAW